MRSYAEAFAAAKDQRPFSNGTEGYGWMGNWCDTCVHDSAMRKDEDPAPGEPTGCPLIAVALNQRTPVEWTDGPRDEHGRYGIEDQYHCTEFRDEDDGPGDGEPEPEPPPVIEGQIDMFGVFADRVIDGSRRVVADVRA